MPTLIFSQESSSEAKFSQTKNQTPGPTIGFIKFSNFLTNDVIIDMSHHHFFGIYLKMCKTNIGNCLTVETKTDYFHKA